jgi:ankyrin repeat protein
MSEGIWRAAFQGDLDEVEGLVGQDPGLLEARDGHAHTPLMWASMKGHVCVVRWLLDKGAAINGRDDSGLTAVWFACSYGHLPVVRLLVERGADPTGALDRHSTPLMAASSRGHLEVVRLLLNRPGARATINLRDCFGRTALWGACDWGHAGVLRALLESGADPTIAHNEGTTPMAIAKQSIPFLTEAEGRRECVAALEVRYSHHRDCAFLCSPGG